MAVLPDTFTPIHAQRHKQQLLMQTSAPAPDSLIVVAVARALFWAGLPETGAFARVSDMARAEGLKPTTVGRMLRLARLAPDIVEDLVHGRQPARLTLFWLMRHDIPGSWAQQRRLMEKFK
jgi:hypothetical protein